MELIKSLLTPGGNATLETVGLIVTILLAVVRLIAAIITAYQRIADRKMRDGLVARLKMTPYHKEKK